VAHHYTEAGLSQLAVDYWERAGQRAVARSANAEALAHFNKALDVLATLPDTPERAQRELGLQVAITFAIPAVKGWGAPECKQAFSRAGVLSQAAPDSPNRFGGLWGLWAFHAMSNEFQTSLHFAEECRAQAQRVGDAGQLVEAYLLLGVSLFWLGELAAARTQLENCSATYDPEHHRDHAFVYGTDPKAGGVALYLPATLCLLGYPEQGLTRSRELLGLARTPAHPHTLAFALYGTAWGHVWRQEWREAQGAAEELIALSAEQGFAFLESAGRCVAARAMVHQGGGAAGAALLRRGLAELKATGMGNFYTSCLPWAAEAAGILEQAREGMNELDDALHLLEQTDQRYAEAELYWIRGTLLEQLASANEHEAEACYLKAIEVARRQQTKLLELRAAMSLSRLWQRHAKHAEARGLLEPVYGWFTEGFDTPDLKDAKALLDELA